MTSARSTIVHEDREGTYHCTARCVRRAFLCGVDALTGRDFEHRKHWARNRLKELAGIFAIDVCGYAVMSNHLHVILRNRLDVAQSWSDEEVARRWLLLYPLRRNLNTGAAEEPNALEILALTGDPLKLAERRRRLSSISWWMRCLDEYLARRANHEDECTGRFWEGRFKCVALLGEAAILSCLAYVDLNPIRAGIAECPETSAFTSGQDRVVARQAKQRLVREKANAAPTGHVQEFDLGMVLEQSKQDQWLCPFQSQGLRRGFLNISVENYLKVLDWTGRQLHSDKPGKIPSDLDPILTRLNVDTESWLETARKFGKQFRRVAGEIRDLEQEARASGQKWFQGQAASRKAFLATAA